MIVVAGVVDHPREIECLDLAARHCDGKRLRDAGLFHEAEAQLYPGETLG
jgi:hypothetical protein